MVVEFAGSAGIGVAVRRTDFLERELVIRADGDWRGFRSAACAKEIEQKRASTALDKMVKDRIFSEASDKEGGILFLKGKIDINGTSKGFIPIFVLLW